MTTLDLPLESEHRQAMYDDLCDRFGQDAVHDVLQAECIDHITQMFDNRDELADKIETDGNV